MAGLLVLSRYGLVDYFNQMVNNAAWAYATLGIYFTRQGIADEQLASKIVAVLKASELFRVVPRYESLAQKGRLIALFMDLGLTKGLNEALTNQLFIDLIQSSLFFNSSKEKTSPDNSTFKHPQRWRI